MVKKKKITIIIVTAAIAFIFAAAPFIVRAPFIARLLLGNGRIVVWEKEGLPSKKPFAKMMFNAMEAKNMEDIKLYPIGKKVQFANISITVEKFKEFPRGKEAVYIPENYSYLGVKVLIKNDSKKNNIEYYGEDFKLWDKDKNILYIAYNNPYITALKNIKDDTIIHPGEEIEGWIVFTVPKSANHLILVYNHLYGITLTGDG